MPETAGSSRDMTCGKKVGLAGVSFLSIMRSHIWIDGPREDAMKRLVPAVLLVPMLCGCAQDRAERREQFGKCLMAPLAAGAACLKVVGDIQKDAIESRYGVENQHTEPTGAMVP
jgi:hypothetical protein